MKQQDNSTECITADCPLYACRVCRTKTGWRHQSWCALSRLLTPDCRDCRYWAPKRAVCAHPARRKERVTA